MSADVVFAVGGALAVAATVYIFWPEWFRKRKPMPPRPPLPMRNPWHERPSEPLSDCEEIRFGILWDSFYHLEAQDPREQQP